MAKEHIYKARVYYADTDAGGVVYHATYLDFAERGRTEMLREAGYDQTRMLETHGTLFTIVNIDVSYRAPARLDDLLSIKSRVARIGGASMEIHQDICLDDKVISELKVTLVCIDKAFKAVRLPDGIRKIFETML